MNIEPLTGVRSDKELLNATRYFAQELRAQSWWYVASTSLILISMLVITVLAPWWPMRLIFSILSGLVVVRGFILFHDYMHGAILRDSRFAKAIFYCYGALLLTPPSSWRESHNYHHRNVGKLAISNIGSFPILTTNEWKKASFSERLKYRVGRHPLTIASAYLSVFLFNICLASFFRNPRKHWGSAIVLMIHLVVIFLVWLSFGLQILLFACILPLWIASALGAYLFYTQHNFPGMRVLNEDEWTYHEAALQTSSYMKFGAVMRWFTGNIGYHHVHHINSSIPFYRLPETMAAIPELQNPKITSLHPRDILACLRLKLWDPSKQRMVSYRDSQIPN